MANYTALDKIIGDYDTYVIYGLNKNIPRTDNDHNFDLSQLLTIGWENIQFQPDGSLRGVPHNDPQLTLPNLTLHADDYSYIQIEMAASTDIQGDARRLQVFYAPPGIDLTQGNSIFLTLTPTEDMTPYTISTTLQLSGWSGDIGTFRLDPVTDGMSDQSWVVIKSIRLIHRQSGQ